MGSFKPFNSSIREEITVINCELLTGYDVYKLIGLCGIYAIISEDEIETYVIEGIYPNPKLTILAFNNQLHIEIELIIDEARIHNELILIKVPKEGYGLKIFRNQIKQAIEAGFKYITLEAAIGYHDDGTPYDGYKVWQKFGYIMTAASQIKFEDLIKKEGRTETSLLQLLSQHTEEEQKKAEELWEKIAFTWLGIFEMAQNSKSQTILKEYLYRKN